MSNWLNAAGGNYTIYNNNFGNNRLVKGSLSNTSRNTGFGVDLNIQNYNQVVDNTQYGDYSTLKIQPMPVEGEYYGPSNNFGFDKIKTMTSNHTLVKSPATQYILLR